MPDGTELRDAKKAFRAAARERRAVYHAEHGAGAGGRLRDIVLQAIPLPPGGVVSGYLPIDDELDPLPLLRAVIGRGHHACVPVVQGRGQPLVFRDWTPEAPLVEGVFGVSVPAPSAPERVPDLLFVPLLGFDRKGFRMGYGAGFYDRTLAGLRARKPVLAVGIGYAGQEVTAVPVGLHDEALDWIVTDREAIRIAV
ncbi:5-formyltetrahydrofolate cyclo-ligase [Inquilinus limosus]|uniref:5-formyltetrahydrofolate cyclo-ligase n=1 Tax=Inquilinus limosus TaxID=171674 RepID=A0A211ZGK7_9PROT|nr:5-formyltetrahydrofolate cyclo-ligase [Inquilinus limosus]OWJ64412.1 5-formyltetrahydrofolate cyclo-ligase [Inquilinus limosus]